MFEEPLVQLNPKVFEESDVPEDNLPVLTWNQKTECGREPLEKKQLRNNRDRSPSEVRETDSEPEVVPGIKRPVTKKKRSVLKTKRPPRRRRKVQKEDLGEAQVARDEDQPFQVATV